VRLCVVWRGDAGWGRIEPHGFPGAEGIGTDGLKVLREGRHLRGAVSTPNVTGPRDLKWSPSEYANIPEAVFWQSQTKEIEDLAGFCVYVGTWSGSHALELSDYVELLSAALGTDLTEAELMTIGRRSISLEKAFNTLHAGFHRKHDYPPKRFREEPIRTGPFAGTKWDSEKWDAMLDTFYGLHGWDKQTGWQTKGCLMELGMEDVAQRLEQHGKLI
jgi:aldehyde:ferredoxin oxidoreductase